MNTYDGNWTIVERLQINASASEPDDKGRVLHLSPMGIRDLIDIEVSDRLTAIQRKEKYKM